MRLSTPVLSDPDLTVSKAYHASEYGMMGTSRDEHTFILGKPDGSIGWRADYGGAPKYTMFVPIAGLLADLKAGTGRGDDGHHPAHPTRLRAVRARQQHPREDRPAHAGHRVGVDLGSPEGQALADTGWLIFAPGVLIDGQPFSHGRLSERRLRRARTRTATASSRSEPSWRLRCCPSWAAWPWV